MKISIFTPSHHSKYLKELYASIKNQDFFEWVIVPNNGCKIPEEIETLDSRIHIFPLEVNVNFVGALKKYACSKCQGDIFLELDHDDLLMPEAIKEVKEAFKDLKIGFVYSNTANFTGNFQKARRFNLAHGWKYRPVKYNKYELEEHVAWKPTPASVSRIWYAPNHLRAWRKDIYFKSGGHPEDMRVLDDQDLLARTYLITKFKHIDKCLYLQRITGENTWLKHNKEIQNNVMRLYDKYIEKLCLKWATDNNLLKLDLGGRFNKPEGYQSVDLKNADIICNLESKWNLKDNSVGLIRAYDVLEHLKDPIHTMKEVYRVLVPGGYFLSRTPSTDGRGAFMDPTHASFWNENSFWYYTNQEYAQYIDIPVKFQDMCLYTGFPNEWAKKNNIPYVIAHLIKLKENRLPGIIKI